MPFDPLPRTPVDPGTPLSRRLTLLAAVVLSLIVMGMQNVPPVIEFFSDGPVAETESEAGREAEPAAGPVVIPPQMGDPPNTLGRMFIKMSDLVAHDPQTLPTLDRFGATEADRLRAAVVAGEIKGDEEAAERLETLASGPGVSGAIAEDARDLLPIYASGTTEESPGRTLVSAEAASRLREHHGYYADVALTRGLPDDHPDRAPLLSGGVALVAIALGAFAVIGLALLAGGVLLIVWIVQASRGKMRPRMPRPEPGGSVFLEVYVLFVGGFLLLKLVMGALHDMLPGAAWLGALGIALQWSLLAVVLWPRIRGMNADGLSRAMGWHAGSGFWREVGFGVLGYLAGLPVYLLGIGLTFVAMLIATAVRAMMAEGAPPLPNQNLFDIIGGSSPIELVLFLSLAVLWAPLCEESVFRGALYRHFRGKAGIVVAAVGSAALFGFMHGYGPLFVFPLIALGSVFAVMREWRGSLVAPITAHMLHNGTVTVMLLVAIRFLA